MIYLFIYLFFCCSFAGDFTLHVDAGEFTDSEILVMLGENGTGKTTFIRMLAGLLKADSEDQVPVLNVSYKPQKIAPKFTGTVSMLFHKKIRDAFIHPQFSTDVIKPLEVDRLLDQEVSSCFYCCCYIVIYCSYLLLIFIYFFLFFFLFSLGR